MFGESILQAATKVSDTFAEITSKWLPFLDCNAKYAHWAGKCVSFAIWTPYFGAILPQIANCNL